MIEPASMSDWVQGIAMACLLSAAGVAFSRALRDRSIPIGAEDEEERELVGSAAG